MNPIRFGSMEIGPARVLVKADNRKEVHVFSNLPNDVVQTLPAIPGQNVDFNQQINDCFGKDRRVKPDVLSVFVNDQLQALSNQYPIDRTNSPTDSAWTIRRAQHNLSEPSHMAVYQLYGQGCLSALIIPTDTFSARSRD